MLADPPSVYSPVFDPNNYGSGSGALGNYALLSGNTFTGANTFTAPSTFNAATTFNTATTLEQGGFVNNNLVWKGGKTVSFRNAAGGSGASMSYDESKGLWLNAVGSSRTTLAIGQVDKLVVTSAGVTVEAPATFNDTVTGLHAPSIGSGAVTDTEFGYLDGVTSGIQGQIDAKQSSLSASNRLDAAFVGGGTVSSTEFGYLDGVTSGIQNQIDLHNAKFYNNPDTDQTVVRGDAIDIGDPISPADQVNLFVNGGGQFLISNANTTLFQGSLRFATLGRGPSNWIVAPDHRYNIVHLLNTGSGPYSHTLYDPDGNSGRWLQVYNGSTNSSTCTFYSDGPMMRGQLNKGQVGSVGFFGAVGDGTGVTLTRGQMRTFTIMNNIWVVSNDIGEG